MKKVWLSLVCVMLAIVLFAHMTVALGEGNVTLSLSDESLIIYRGTPAKLTYKLDNLEDKSNIKVAWTSADAAIATVASGSVTGKSVGQTEITCTVTLKDGTVLTAVCPLEIRNSVSTVVCKTQSLKIDVGQKSEPIAVQITPDDAYDKTLVWTSSDENVATVDKNGVVTGLKAGTAKITAKTADTSLSVAKSVFCNVTVLQPVEQVLLDVETLEIGKGATSKLTATILPGDASDKKLTWSSSDPAVASVAATGAVSAKAPGTTTISATATRSDGTQLTASALVTVFTPTTSVKLPAKPLTVNTESSSEPIEFSVAPTTATYQGVAWSSSDDSIATVDQNGVVTGLKAGKVKIIATSTAPLSGTTKAPSAFMQVTVVQPAKAIKITDDSVRVAKGKTAKLTTDITPADTTNKKLAWISSDPKVATVSENGTITAVGTGDATITATTTDGTDLSATTKVTVYQAVTGLTSKNTGRVAVTEGESITLSVTAAPKDATNKTVKWSSDNEYYATVDANTGKVTGKNVGLVKITATAQDGSGKQVTIPVYVEPQIPLDATTFTRSGYFGLYYEFAVTLKNVTKTRTIKYLSFDVQYTYNGSTNTLYGCYDDRVTLGPGASKRLGWWDQIGYKLSYCSNFRIYLKSVKYSDGTWDYFSDNNLIGWFF